MGKLMESWEKLSLEIVFSASTQKYNNDNLVHFFVTSSHLNSTHIDQTQHPAEDQFLTMTKLHTMQTSVHVFYRH